MEFARSAKYILSAMVIMAGMVLGSCTGDSSAPETTELAAATPKADILKSYTVEFYARGEQIKSETLSIGQLPTVPEVADSEGIRFTGWVDEKGRKAEPAATPVTWDCQYTAVFLPVLDGEGPYLFTGSGGLLKPDAVLDGTELTAALNALAGEAAKAYFPTLPELGDSITAEELRTVLSDFYTSEEMDRVILGYQDVDQLSRAQFAIIMNGLLGRETAGKVIPEEGSYRIPDVAKTRQDYSALMEAAVEHSHSEEGSVWKNISLPALYEEGYVIVEGGLYCADSEGFFVSDTVLGSLTFGYDGRYTSGDAVLDGYVTATVADIMDADTYSDSLKLLRAAYDYSCESFTYLRRNVYELGAGGWEIPEAITMFETRSGNSYSYAAAFWALARSFGYEATAVNGTVGAERQPHAWVEIVIDGETFWFDPAIEAGALEGVEAGKNMFMLSEDTAAAWGYYKG